MIRLTRLLLPALAIPWLLGSLAQAQELQIEATVIEHKSEAKVYRYRDARLRFEELVLDAGLIVVNLETNKAIATEDVHYREKNVAGTAERVEVNLTDKTATLYNADVYDMSSGYYLTADTVVRLTEDHFTAEDCAVTSCKPRQGGWTIELSDVDYRVNDYATGSNSVLRLGDVPTFWFPFIAWPTVNQRSTGFLPPRISTESSSRERFHLGTRLKLPFFWVLGVDQDLTLTPDIISQRGVGTNFDYNYAFWNDQTGRVRFFRIQEAYYRHPDEENIPLGYEPGGDFKPTRETLDVQHNQGFGGNQRVVFALAHSSDGQVRREYDHVPDYRPERDYEASYAAATDWGEFAVTTAHASSYTDESVFADSARFTDGRLRPRLLPQVSYSVGGRPLRTSRLGLDVQARATDFTTAALLNGRASELQPGVSYPVNLGGSWELRPSVARRFVQFDGLTQSLPGLPEDDLASEKYAQNIYDVELRSTFSRTYGDPELEGEILTKHRIVPRLIYYEVQDVAQPLAGSLNQTDAERLAGGTFPEVPAALISPDTTHCLEDLTVQCDLLSMRAGVVAPLYTQKLLTLRLDNLWLRSAATGSDVGADRWLRLDFIQRYNLLHQNERTFEGPVPDPDRQETAPDEPLLPLIIDGDLEERGFRLGWLLHYHHQLNIFNQRELSISGRVSARGSMAIRYEQNDFSYLTPDNRFIPSGSRLSIGSVVNASSEYQLGFSGTINVRDRPAPLGRRLETGEVYLDYHPGCYALRLAVEENLTFSRETTGPAFEIQRKVVLTFDLGGLFTARDTTELASEGG